MQPSQSAPRPLLTALEVQERLSIDRSTVYRMAEDGRLPAIRVGRSWRFPTDQIEALLNSPDAPRPRGTDGAGTAATVAGPTNPLPTSPLPTSPASTGPASTGPTLGPIGPSPTSSAPMPAPPDPPTIATADPAEPNRSGAAPALNTVAARAAVEVAADLLGVMMVVTDMDGHPVTDVTNPCTWFSDHAADPGVLDSCVTEWREMADHPDLTPRFRDGALGFQCARAFVRSGSALVGMVLAGGVSPSADPSSDPDLYHLDAAARQRVLSALPRIAAAISTTAPRPAAAPKENS